MNDKKCKTCAYFVYLINEEDGMMGTCRVNPPVFSEDYQHAEKRNTGMLPFPLIEDWWWCRKHK